MKKIINEVVIEVSVYGDFFKFLEEHKALLPFLSNVEESGYSFVSYFDRKPCDWISAHCSWHRSPQGHAYWEKLDREWRKLLKEGLPEDLDLEGARVAYKVV